MDRLFEEFMDSFKHESLSILGFEQVSDSDKKLQDLLRSDELNDHFQIFLEDDSGSCVAFWKFQNTENEPIVYFDSGGMPVVVIARNFKEFLSLLYFGTYAPYEIVPYLSYIIFKSKYEQAGIEYPEPQPKGMSKKDLQKAEKDLRKEYSNYDKIIDWLHEKNIEKPSSLFDIVVNAYNQSPNLKNFLAQKLGTN